MTIEGTGTHSADMILAELRVRASDPISRGDAIAVLLYRLWSRSIHNRTWVAPYKGEVPDGFARWVKGLSEGTYEDLDINERNTLEALRNALKSADVREFLGIDESSF